MKASFQSNLAVFDEPFEEAFEGASGALLRSHVQEPGVRRLAAEVGEHALALLLAHFRVDRLAVDLPLLQVVHLILESTVSNARIV